MKSKYKKKKTPRTIYRLSRVPHCYYNYLLRILTVVTCDVVLTGRKRRSRRA